MLLTILSNDVMQFQHDSNKIFCTVINYVHAPPDIYLTGAMLHIPHNYYLIAGIHHFI